MTVVATDSFTYSDGVIDSVALTNWASPTDAVFVQTLLISSSQVKANSTGANAVSRWIGAGTFSDDQYSKVTVVTAGDYAGRVCVQVDASANMYFFQIQSGTGKIYKWTSGSGSELVSWSQSISNGDTMKLSKSGGVLTAYVNDAEVKNVTDTGTVLSGGKPGISMYTENDTPRLDDWEGGNVDATTVACPWTTV